jgi:WXG100 family type VII secretion target
MADEQFYNHAGINQVADDLQEVANKLQNRLDQFSQDVKKELPNWEGEAANSFEVFHRQWNEKIKELQLYASQLPALVQQINQNAQQTDKKGASLFQ